MPDEKSYFDRKIPKGARSVDIMMVYTDIIEEEKDMPAVCGVWSGVQESTGEWVFFPSTATQTQGLFVKHNNDDEEDIAAVVTEVHQKLDVLGFILIRRKKTVQDTGYDVR